MKIYNVSPHLDHEAIRLWAVQVHASTNHMYAKDKPYAYHLGKVAEVVVRYSHLIPENWFDHALTCAFTHDLIEDARQTYNDVKHLSDEHIAEVTRALTNNVRGRTRAERADATYYYEITQVYLATFVKLCDIIANTEESKSTGSSMYAKYKSELPNVIEKLYDPQYDEMFEHLKSL